MEGVPWLADDAAMWRTDLVCIQLWLPHEFSPLRGQTTSCCFAFSMVGLQGISPAVDRHSIVQTESREQPPAGMQMRSNGAVKGSAACYPSTIDKNW